MDLGMDTDFVANNLDTIHIIAGTTLGGLYGGSQSAVSGFNVFSEVEMTGNHIVDGAINCAMTSAASVTVAHAYKTLPFMP